MEGLGNEVVVPKEPTEQTLNLGTKHAPEFACLPLKIILGTFLEGLERGADTIVMSGGVGPCRAGYYSEVQRRILESLGRDFRMIILEPPMSHKKDTLEKIKMLNTAKIGPLAVASLIYRVCMEIAALDKLEVVLRKVVPREASPGSAEAAYRKGVEMVKSSRNLREVRETGKEALRLLEAVPKDPLADPVRVGIVGEIYVLLEPSSNLYMERILGQLGAEVTRSMYLTKWMMHNLVVEGGGREAKRAAMAYLSEMVGGHGKDSVGNTILYARNGMDGVIQLAPFTCIPEIVAKGVLASVSEDFDIPVLSFFLDEQTGEAGVRTRLEAFVDMLVARRAKDRESLSGCRRRVG